MSSRTLSQSLLGVSACLAISLASAGVQAQVAPTLLYHGGPVISAPKVFLLFWGPFSTAEKTAAINYTKGFSQLLGNGASGNGLEPTLRQYGVWGGYYAGSATGKTTRMPNINQATVTAEITRMQNISGSNKVPPYDPTLFILVVGKQVLPNCASLSYHSNAGLDKYYGVASYMETNCGNLSGFTVEQWFEAMSAHETVEMATNPAGGAWFYEPAGNTEVNDFGGPPAACSTNDTVVFPNGVTGLCPHIIDNISASCSTFTTLEHAGISVTQSSSGINAFVRGSNNALWVVNSANGTSWGTPQNLGGGTWDPPAAIANGTTQDVFVRGGDSRLYQYHKSGNQAWTGPAGISAGLVFGPPAAAYHGGHIKVFANSYDGHPYVFDDGGTGTWTFAALPIPSGGVQAMSPPRVFPRAGLGTIDILFSGNNGHLYRTSWGAEASCPSFTDLGGSLVGLPWESSRSSDTTRVDIFFPGLGQDVWQDIITSGNSSGFIFQGGLIHGSPAAADWGTSSINLFARNSGLGGGTLYMTTATNGVAFNGFSPVSPALSITSSPYVLPPASGSNVMRVFSRRHSDGHLIHQSFNGTTAGAQQDLGVVVH